MGLCLSYESRYVWSVEEKEGDLVTFEDSR